MAKWPKGVATAILIFLKKKIKIKNKNYGQYEKFWIQLVKLKKIGTLRGWIAKIETLVFELKKAVNFEGKL
jgi:hypothetical protein